ncbi:MAG: alpha/beta hydrolase [Gemmatimonadota bacterium]|jgi:phospholipase/carboxylesterase|nr:alpha/beta hydrolase [Gemmatimonadota bacterium]
MTYVHLFRPATDPTAATLVLLHGTGGDEHDLLPLADLLAPGAAVLSPRGNVLERGMPRFFRRLAEGVFDVEDVVRRSDELSAFVRDEAGRRGVDPARLWAVGFSNGANIAAAVLLRHPGVFAGGVLLAPMVPIVPERLPDLGGTAVFLGAGRQDHIAPPAQPEALADLFRRSGADVTLDWHPGGHQLVPSTVHAARAWLAARLAGPGDA